MDAKQLTKGMKVRNTKTGKVYSVTYGFHPSAPNEITLNREIHGRKVGPTFNANPADLEAV